MTHHNEQGHEADTMGRVTERSKVAAHAEGSSLNAGSIPAASQLNEAVKRIAELDAKRTQGEWIAEHDEDEGDVTVWAGSAIDERHTGIYDTAGEMKLYSTVFGDSESDAELLANAAFIAAAPLMAATVAKQATIIEQQRAVMEMAREALWVAHENSKLWNGEKYNVTIQTGDALAALDAALGRV